MEKWDFLFFLMYPECQKTQIIHDRKLFMDSVPINKGKRKGGLGLSICLHSQMKMASSIKEAEIIR